MRSGASLGGPGASRMARSSWPSSVTVSGSRMVSLMMRDTRSSGVLGEPCATDGAWSIPRYECTSPQSTDTLAACAVHLERPEPRSIFPGQEESSSGKHTDNVARLTSAMRTSLYFTRLDVDATSGNNARGLAVLASDSTLLLFANIRLLMPAGGMHWSPRLHSTEQTEPRSRCLPWTSPLGRSWLWEE